MEGLQDVKLHEELVVLEYPYGDPRDQADVQRLVMWLEDVKIRHCAPEERQKLRHAQDWLPEFHQYLKLLNCPFESLAQQLGWLVRHAISLEYEEKADEINAALSSNKETQRLEKELDGIQRDVQVDLDSAKPVDVQLHKLYAFLQHKLAKSSESPRQEKPLSIDTYEKHLTPGFDTKGTIVTSFNI